MSIEQVACALVWGLTWTCKAAVPLDLGVTAVHHGTLQHWLLKNYIPFNIINSVPSLKACAALTWLQNQLAWKISFKISRTTNHNLLVVPDWQRGLLPWQEGWDTWLRALYAFLFIPFPLCLCASVNPPSHISSPSSSGLLSKGVESWEERVKKRKTGEEDCKWLKWPCSWE